jgi:hypothetical protein
MIDGPHHIITYSETGESEPRRLLTDDQLRFDVRMALMKSPALGGLQRHDRDRRTHMIEEAVAAYIKVCGYQVFSGIAQPRPASGTWCGKNRKD